MNGGTLLLVLGGTASALTILSVLGFAPNGPHIVANIRARLGATRQHVRQLYLLIDALNQKVDRLNQYADSLHEYIKDTNKSQLENMKAHSKMNHVMGERVEMLESLLHETRDQLAKVRAENERMAPLVEQLHIAYGEEVAGSDLPDPTQRDDRAGAFPVGDGRNAGGASPTGYTQLTSPPLPNADIWAHPDPLALKHPFTPE